MSTNPAAQLARRRWDLFTPQEKAEHIAKMCKGRKKQAKKARREKGLAQG